MDNLTIYNFTIDYLTIDYLTIVVVGGGVLYGVETNVAQGLCEDICLPLLGKRGLKMGYGVLHDWIKDFVWMKDER